jgi:hypothetical protein
MSAVILPFDDRGRSRITSPVLPGTNTRMAFRRWSGAGPASGIIHGYGPGHRVAHCGSRGAPT